MGEAADHLAGQPEIVRSKILYVQAMYGSTGDTKPWPGHPADPQVNLTSKSEEFLQYIREVNTRLCVEHQDTGIIPLFVGEDWLDEFNSEMCPRHWKKRGKVAHGYQMNSAQNEVCDSIQFSSQQEDEDGSACGGGSEKTKEHVPRAGLGKEWSGNGKVVSKVETKRVSSYHQAPGDQDGLGEVGQDVRGGGGWSEAGASAERVEREGEEAGEGDEEEQLAPE